MASKILITGASGGFGKLTSLALLKAGHTVVASMRGPEGKNAGVAAELRAAGASIVEMDVTDDASVTAGVTLAVQAAGGLDVVINNAGVGVIGLQESFTPEDWQSLFNINVFGVQRVNRAALPYLREQGSGLLVHVSSLLGRMVLPFLGPYNASKWALEALADNYRVELGVLGVDSVLVEPGAFATGFIDALITPSDTSRDASYGDMADAPRATIEGFEGALASNPAQDPQLVADAIVDLIATPAGQRPFRTVVDKMGMGDGIAPLNAQLEQVTKAVYGGFGMADFLKLKV